MQVLCNFLLTFLQAGTNSLLFRSDKIFTVLTVVLLIWAGIATGLMLTNRKISRLEKELEKKKGKAES